MKAKIVILALLAAIALVSCMPAAKIPPTAQTHQRLREIQEATIYELLLQDECKSSYQGSPVLIIDQTVSEISFDEESVFWIEPSLDKETWEQYIKINQSSQAFIPDLSIHKFCMFITSDELVSLTQKDPNWFNDHMVISFSRVGFSSSLDQALVYREYNCGGECAGGDLYFLVLENNLWKIKNTVGGWNS